MSGSQGSRKGGSERTTPPAPPPPKYQPPSLRHAGGASERTSTTPPSYMDAVAMATPPNPGAAVFRLRPVMNGSDQATSTEPSDPALRPTVADSGVQAMLGSTAGTPERGGTPNDRSSAAGTPRRQRSFAAAVGGGGASGSAADGSNWQMPPTYQEATLHQQSTQPPLSNGGSVGPSPTQTPDAAPQPAPRSTVPPLEQPAAAAAAAAGTTATSTTARSTKASPISGPSPTNAAATAPSAKHPTASSTPPQPQQQGPGAPRPTKAQLRAARQQQQQQVQQQQQQQQPQQQQQQGVVAGTGIGGAPFHPPPADQQQQQQQPVVAQQPQQHHHQHHHHHMWQGAGPMHHQGAPGVPPYPVIASGNVRMPLVPKHTGLPEMRCHLSRTLAIAVSTCRDLGRDLSLFDSAMALNDAAVCERERFIRLVRRTARRVLGPTAEVSVHGSYKADLCVPGSDVDIAVSGCPDGPMAAMRALATTFQEMTQRQADELSVELVTEAAEAVAEIADARAYAAYTGQIIASDVVAGVVGDATRVAIGGTSDMSAGNPSPSVGGTSATAASPDGEGGINPSALTDSFSTGLPPLAPVISAASAATPTAANHPQHHHQQQQQQQQPPLLEDPSGMPLPFTIETVPYARVPIIKLTEVATGIHGDVACGGGDPTRSHEFVKSLVAKYPVDGRRLILLLKALVRQEGIAEGMRGGISSFAIYLLVSHFLSQRDAERAVLDEAIIKAGTAAATTTTTTADGVDAAAAATPEVGDRVATTTTSKGPSSPSASPPGTAAATAAMTPAGSATPSLANSPPLGSGGAAGTPGDVLLMGAADDALATDLTEQLAAGGEDQQQCGHGDAADGADSVSGVTSTTVTAKADEATGSHRGPSASRSAGGGGRGTMSGTVTSANDDDEDDDDDDDDAERGGSPSDTEMDHLDSEAGELFVDFCYFYGHAFDFARKGIRFYPDGRSEEVPKPDMCTRRNQFLHMTSPFDTEYDISQHMSHLQHLQHLLVEFLGRMWEYNSSVAWALFHPIHNQFIVYPLARVLAPERWLAGPGPVAVRAFSEMMEKQTQQIAQQQQQAAAAAAAKDAGRQSPAAVAHSDPHQASGMTTPPTAAPTTTSPEPATQPRLMGRGRGQAPPPTTAAPAPRSASQASGGNGTKQQRGSGSRSSGVNTPVQHVRVPVSDNAPIFYPLPQQGAPAAPASYGNHAGQPHQQLAQQQQLAYHQQQHQQHHAYYLAQHQQHQQQQQQGQGGPTKGGPPPAMLEQDEMRHRSEIQQQYQVGLTMRHQQLTYERHPRHGGGGGSATPGGATSPAAMPSYMQPQPHQQQQVQPIAQTSWSAASRKRNANSAAATQSTQTGTELLGQADAETGTTPSGRATPTAPGDVTSKHHHQPRQQFRQQQQHQQHSHNSPNQHQQQQQMQAMMLMCGGNGTPGQYPGGWGYMPHHHGNGTSMLSAAALTHHANGTPHHSHQPQQHHQQHMQAGYGGGHYHHSGGGHPAAHAQDPRGGRRGAGSATAGGVASSQGSTAGSSAAARRFGSGSAAGGGGAAMPPTDQTRIRSKKKKAGSVSSGGSAPSATTAAGAAPPAGGTGGEGTPTAAASKKKGKKPAAATTVST